MRWWHDSLASLGILITVVTRQTYVTADFLGGPPKFINKFLSIFHLSPLLLFGPDCGAAQRVIDVVKRQDLSRVANRAFCSVVIWLVRALYSRETSVDVWPAAFSWLWTSTYWCFDCHISPILCHSFFVLGLVMKRVKFQVDGVNSCENLEASRQEILTS